MSIASPPGPSLLPTKKTQKPSMARQAHHFTPPETLAGHSPEAGLLAAPLLPTRLRFIRQLLVMSGSPPIPDSFTPPTLGRALRPSRTCLPHGTSRSALLPVLVGTLLCLLSRRSLDQEGSTVPMILGWV